jgi:cyclopropane-fatty-acyl-phospholipid synthase
MSATAAARRDEGVDPAGASAEAIQTHYDVSNEFYALWLDRSMTYSCALWDEADDLETAQVRKLDLHLEQAQARGAKRLLDVGCGWGALLDRAVRHFDVEHAVGLTLSRAQFDWVNASRNPRVDVRLDGWESHVAAEPYDAIVSVGAFEHFVRPGLPRCDKVQAYRRFFQWCHDNSADSSWLSVQSIVYENYDENAPNDFVKLVFPESDLPRLSEITEAMQGLYEIVKLRNDREHYARTLRVWLSNLRRSRGKLISRGDEALYRKYEKYLGVFVVGFHVGTVNLTRLAAKRISAGGISLGQTA